MDTDKRGHTVEVNSNDSFVLFTHYIMFFVVLLLAEISNNIIKQM